MDRRSFLRGALALSAVAVAAPKVAFAAVPPIYGDGIHDDWAGLQAMFDGKPFQVEGETITAEDGVVKGGDFILSRTLRISRDNVIVTESNFTAKNWEEGKSLIECGRLVTINIRNCVFDGRAIAGMADASTWLPT